jgi:hypothetical protein
MEAHGSDPATSLLAIPGLVTARDAIPTQLGPWPPACEDGDTERAAKGQPLAGIQGKAASDTRSTREAATRISDAPVVA